MSENNLIYHNILSGGFRMSASDFLFNFRETELIGQFMANALTSHDLALEIKSSLVDRCIIDPYATTRYMIECTPDFAPLLKALSQVMAMCLPREIANSRYGMGFVSDFDLVTNFGTENARKIFLAKNESLTRQLGYPQLEELKSNAAKLRRFIVSQRRSLIDHWDLPDGDYNQKKSSSKMKRAIATVETVAQSTESILEDLSNTQSKKMYLKFKEGKIE
jgi:hypothetical protein